MKDAPGSQHHRALSRQNTRVVEKLTVAQIAARKLATLIPAVLWNRKRSNR